MIAIISLIIGAGIAIYLQSFAWTNPSQAPSGGGGALYYSGGNVGIGTMTPAQKLSVAGIIESTTGGFKFPDGMTQTTSATNAHNPMFHVYVANTHSVPQSVWTKVQLNTETFDTSGVFDSVTNYRFTVPTGGAGIYLLGAGVRMGAITTNAIYTLALHKNNALYKYLGDDTSVTPFNYHQSGSALLSLNAGDYIEVYVYTNSSPIDLIRGEANSYFWGMKVN